MNAGRGAVHDAGTSRSLQDHHRFPTTDAAPGRQVPWTAEDSRRHRPEPCPWALRLVVRPPAAAGKSSSWSAGSRFTRPGPRVASGGPSGTRAAAAAVRGCHRGEAGGQAREGRDPAASRRAEHEEARCSASSPTTWTLIGSRSMTGGRASTSTPSAGCALHVAPIVDAVGFQDIKTSHMQQIVNAARPQGRRPDPTDDLCARHRGGQGCAATMGL